MSRRRQRFSNLFKVLREGGAPEAGTPAAGFLQFLQGARRVNVVNTIPEAGRDRIRIALLPFGVPVGTGTPADRYESTITKYSLSGINSRSAIPVAAGVIDIAGVRLAEAGNQVSSEYYPALFKIAVSRGADTVRTKTSAVTNKSYKTRETRTFILPFGRSTNTSVKDIKTGATQSDLDKVEEIEVYRALRTTALSTTTEADKPKSVSYEPELFKQTTSNAQTVTDLIATGNLSVE
jgi:hypothetical protein